jgi:SAM-dependent methyltransferase
MIRLFGYELVKYQPSHPKGNIINRLIIDSSDSITDLCRFGSEFPTDKSPFKHSIASQLHRHPYTAVYDLLFAKMRYEAIVFGEIGILRNQSMMCWRSYFPNAILYGWDIDKEKLKNAEKAALRNTKYGLMNVKEPVSISQCLSSANQKFDVLIDDSTHEFDDQIRVIEIATEYLRPGGILAIEDIYQGRDGYDEDSYSKSLIQLRKYFSSIVFIDCRHKYRYSYPSNNDKLLVLFRNSLVGPFQSTTPICS